MGGGRLLSQNHNPKYLREKDGLLQQIAKEMTPNGWIIFKDEAKVNAATFFATYANSLGIGQHYEYQLTKEETDNLKIRHQRYLLYYKKTPVEGSEFTLHSRDGILLTAHGRIVEDMDFDLSKPMSEQKALDYALTDKGLSKADFKGQRKPPQGRLVLAQIGDDFSKSSFKIAYAFDVYGKRGSLDVHTVYIDASDGKVLKRIPLVLQCFGTVCNHTDKKHTETLNDPMPTINNNLLIASTFTPRFNNTTSRYGGQQNFETENNPNGAGLRLSMNNGSLVTRRDALGLWDPNNADPEAVFNGNLDVVNPNDTWGTNQQNTTTTHWAVQRAYNYFNTAHGRNGPSNNGAIARVIADIGETNAGWWPVERIMAIGFSPTSTTNIVPNLNNSLVTLDIIGHEYAHAIVQFTAGLIGAGQPASLNEGIADIFGTALERNVLPNNWNWTIGEDAWTIRDMQNPANPLPPFTFAQPIIFQGDNWRANSWPVHHNNGVLNRWFYTICTGNRINGTTTVSINFDNATAIVYRALSVYLQSSSGYADMRNATVQAAKDLYGGCSNEALAVHNAWWDANLEGTSPCINNCDFNLTASSFNPNPACGSAFTLNAACSGNNCAGVSYTWTGQGGVRYGQQVSYTAPNSNGNYTYSLTASRSGCSDKTANVTVNVTNCGGGSNSCAGGNFGGHFDTGNCNIFNGWALDHSNYGRTLDVDILVDGTKVATVTANQNRPDLGAAFGNAAANPHGWSYNIPVNASWRNGTNRTVTARICGASADLNDSPKTVNCTGGTGTPPPTPTTCAGGNFNGHFDSGNCGIFNGWALDHNNYGRTVDVEIRVDGVLVTTVQANQNRPDLGVAFGTSAAIPHGWSYNPPASASWRNGTKTVSARICGATSDLYNSPKTVNFSNCRIGVEENNKEVFAVRRSDSSEDFLNDTNNLILSPNPTNGELRFRLKLSSKTDVSVSLSDLAGRILQTKVYKNREGQLDERLELGTLPDGSYIFVLQTVDKKYSRKVMVLR